MSGKRTLYLDDAPGEFRGVVVLDGQPERLLIERASERPEHRAGAHLVARVRRIDHTLATAFLDVGNEPDAVLPLAGLKGLSEGARITVQIVASPRVGKGAVARMTGEGQGEPRVLTPAPAILDQLQAFAPDAPVRRGADAREAADAAEDAALAVEHALKGGGRISIEPTRALTAVDVDMGAVAGDSRRAAALTNRAAIYTAARLLRLKGLGGLIVFDLIGKGHDGRTLSEAARLAFKVDQPGVSIGAISRFGLLEMALPRRGQPLAERLLDAGGAPTPETTALRLLRRMQADVAPGAYIEGRCSPDSHLIALTLAPLLTARIGPRFRLVADPALSPGALQTRAFDRMEPVDGR